jgi:hypothetical protein
VKITLNKQYHVGVIEKRARRNSSNCDWGTILVALFKLEYRDSCDNSYDISWYCFSKYV